jgi:LacI family transcriptional regulator
VKDVAARSGVSFQTTSKVLNGGGAVSKATRARILAAARELGYVRNLQARSLVMQRTRTIGLIFEDLSDHRLGQVILGAEREARRQNYGIVIVGIEPGESATDNALPSMLGRRVDGIVVAAPHFEEDRVLADALDTTLPIVSIYDNAGSQIPTIAPDYELAGYLATSHLLEAGHRLIATIVGPPGRSATERALRGYRRALENAGLVAHDALVQVGGSEISGGVNATTLLFERSPTITAMFCQSDGLAIGALSALRHLGKIVPLDCSVIGCDDTDLAAFCVPALTTIHVPFYEIGAGAMRLILTALATGDEIPSQTLMQVRLVMRESTTKAGSGASRRAS